MGRLTQIAALACIAGATALPAQQPGGRQPPGRRAPGAMPQGMPQGMPQAGGFGGGPGAMGGPAANPAEFLLAHTGEFRLTDAQVTRLAAIARRAADRRQTMRARLDSLRPEGPGRMRDSAAREQFRARTEQMRPAMERLREQAQADRRDAIAVLTPDQQAQAWERIATMGRGGRGPGGNGMRGMRGARMRGAMMRARPGRPGDQR